MYPGSNIIVAFFMQPTTRGAIKTLQVYVHGALVSSIFLYTLLFLIVNLCFLVRLEHCSFVFILEPRFVASLALSYEQNERPCLTARERGRAM